MDYKEHRLTGASRLRLTGTGSQAHAFSGMQVQAPRYRKTGSGSQIQAPRYRNGGIGSQVQAYRFRLTG